MKIPDTKYTKFSNEALKALCQLRLSGGHMAVFLYILRHTIGCQKEKDNLSISRMARETGYSRKWMIGVVGDLESMGILKVARRKSGSISSLELRDPEYWDEPLYPLPQWLVDEQPVNSTSHVNYTSQGCELQFTGGVNNTSQVGVNSTSQVPVNYTSHTKERRKKKILKKAIDQPLEAASDRDQKNRIAANAGDRSDHSDSSDNDDSTDPIEQVRRWKAANGHL